ncbi:glycerate kinase [Halobacillus rhizosphaerae]|uniref:glycerate kinase n=1 Tax=Halobacillus rhizosphaerae TaxID=3064889 RepID=UPI00398B8DF2
MKVLFAPDSYKGSLSSGQVAETMARAFQSADPQVEALLMPMADGGENTLEALSKAAPHTKVSITCTGPLGERRESEYIHLEADCTVIEIAAISGLPLVPEDQRNPDLTTTYGIGEAIRHALDQGHRDFIMAIGGSSTNDGGFGMLQALGMKAFNEQNEEVGMFGKDLFQISRIDFTTLDSRLQECTIQVASDVDNPLTGTRGASYVYGPQKGADPEQLAAYDQQLAVYGHLVEAACGKDLMHTPGAGAAGGLGFAFLAIGAELRSGAELVAEAIHLDAAIQEADIVVTGEGQSDEQTLYGKAPGYVAETASRYDKPVYLLSGSLDGNMAPLNRFFTGCFSIVPGPKSLAECLANAEDYLYQASHQLARVLVQNK